MLKLCDKGIPDTVRGRVWTVLAGVGPKDNNVYYSLLEQKKWNEETEIQINKDISRTMPGHILFQEKGQGFVFL